MVTQINLSKDTLQQRMTRIASHCSTIYRSKHSLYAQSDLICNTLLKTDLGSIFNWIVTLLNCWIFITLLNSVTFLGRNSMGRRYVDGSEFHYELWPRVRIPRLVMTPIRFPHWIVIQIPGQNLNLNHALGSQFKRCIKTWAHTSTRN